MIKGSENNIARRMKPTSETTNHRIHNRHPLLQLFIFHLKLPSKRRHNKLIKNTLTIIISVKGIKNKLESHPCHFGINISKETTMADNVWPMWSKRYRSVWPSDFERYPSLKETKVREPQSLADKRKFLITGLP
jgi:hypothetical protein